MDLLPPHLKHKILSFDPNLMNAAYGDNDKKNKKEEKEEKTTYPSLTIKDESKLHSLSPSQVKELEKEGYLVVDNFLGRESLLKFKADAIKMHESGDLRPAKMNKGEEQWKLQEIRGDSIKWLNNREKGKMKEEYGHLCELLEREDGIRLELDEACSFNSSKSQVQIARYAAGTRYVRHRDSFIGSTEPSRRLTCIYYLNESWKPEDGGCLRMFLGEGKEKDVEPIGDRLILFWSAYIDHEVLLSHSERYAVTMWYY